MADTVSKSIVDTRSDAAEEADLDAEPGADLAAQRVILPDVVGEWLLSLAISQTAHTQSNDFRR
jgi:hypothetical protein